MPRRRKVLVLGTFGVLMLWSMECEQLMSPGCAVLLAINAGPSAELAKEGGNIKTSVAQAVLAA